MQTLRAGRYELLEELGRGAMGVVHKAHDPVIGRTVAVKTMRLSEAGTGLSREELIRRFHTEARAAGLLAHPNIVVVYDAGEEDELFYLTMEYVPGRSLQSLMDEGQAFLMPRALRIMEQACAALEHAHRRNVVHRDVKPANLLLLPDDTLKVTDFGTAKILQHAVGTPSYMSPEQIRGRALDRRSDIFSLGVILYELVTGQKPFPGKDITTVIYRIVNEEPVPPRALGRTIHPGLSHAITTALAKDPAARYQSCGEFFEALQHYREIRVSQPVQSPTTRTKPSAGVKTERRAHPLVPPAARPTASRQAAALLAFLLAVLAATAYLAWPSVRDMLAATQSRLRSGGTASPTAAAAQGSQGAPRAEASAAPVARPHNPGSQEQPEPPTATPLAPAESRGLPGPSLERLRVLRERIEWHLEQAGLADRVRVFVGQGGVWLSGQLTLRERRALALRLRDLPDAHLIRLGRPRTMP